MLWVLILKLLDLFEGLLDYFVAVSVQFTKADDGQWQLSWISSEPTEKGQAVLAAVATIIHNGLDFVAQFTTLLPAKADIWYNNIIP